jgi:hypothetical protein
MTASMLDRQPVAQLASTVTSTSAEQHSWRTLYRTAALAAGLMVLIIPVSAVVFVVWPPPLTDGAGAWFALFQESWLRGLLALDLLFLLSNALMIPLYLALYVALRKASESLMLLALGTGFVGLASYFSSNTAFQILFLSNEHAAATTEAERAALIAAGEAMTATYIGTAFNVYYALSTIALLLIAVVMLRSTVFSRWVAYAALVSGILMIIPSSAGTLGLVFSLLSLIPWIVFLLLIVRRFLELSESKPHRERQGAS